MSDEEKKEAEGTEEEEKKEEKPKGIPKLKRQLDKIREWVDANEGDIKSLKANLGDGHDLVKDFMNACLKGKPEDMKDALTEFEDVNELIINEAELAALGTGPDFVALLSTVWKGIILVSKVAAQVAGMKASLEDNL